MAFLTLLKRMNAKPKGAKRSEREAEMARPCFGPGDYGSRVSRPFKTWAEEVATFPHAAIEHAMGHKVGGKVERAYTRTTLLDMRRKLMDAWAAYCEPDTSTAAVVQLEGRRKRPR